jgi:polar amino acid transport system substrate-binding protein
MLARPVGAATLAAVITSSSPRRLFAICLALTALAGCGPRTQTARPLIVGMELQYPPFEMTDAKGTPAGISVEMAEAMAAHLGRPLEVRNMAFSGLIEALRTGKIDCILSSMTATPERDQAIDFSEPYLRTGLCLLVRKDAPIQSIADADSEGRVLAVKQGTTGHTYAAAELKKAALKVFDQDAACVLEVVQGKADAFIYDQMSIYRYWKRNEETTRAVLKPFREEAWAVGIREGDTELRDGINAFLAKFKAEGGFERLGDKYLHEEKQAFRELGVPFFF